MSPRVFGIDFSGAADAHRLIWVAECEPAAGGLRVLSCMAASDRFGAKSRDEAYQALTALVRSEPRGLFGFDFPFSVHAALVRAEGAGDGAVAGAWKRFAAGLADRFSSPGQFKDALLERGVRLTGHKELKRLTDREAGTPFSATNLRLYRQTYYGIGSVLGPLVRGGAARVPPFQPPLPGKATVIEICPASTLKKALGIEPAGYKGRGADRRGRRAEIFARLVRGGYVEPVGRGVEEKVVEDTGGDGLDAVIGAAAAHAASALGDVEQAPRSAEEALEGRVYYRLS
jgi:hypothetical protein